MTPPSHICKRCGAANGACPLTCPALRLPAGFRFEKDEEAEQ